MLVHDADGHRVKKTVTNGGTTTQIKDTYQGGRIAYETDGANTLLATFTIEIDLTP